MGSSPWCRRELDMTEGLTLSLSLCLGAGDELGVSSSREAVQSGARCQFFPVATLPLGSRAPRGSVATGKN